MVLALMGAASAPARAAPPDQAAGRQAKLERFCLDCVKALRVAEPRPQPAFVKEFNDKYSRRI